MPFARKTFLSGTLIAVTAALSSCKGWHRAGFANGKPEFFRVLSPQEYDRAAMMAILRVPNAHKQVFSASTAPGPTGSEVFVHMQLAMNGYNFSLGRGSGSLATLGVLTGPSVILGLTDEMWQKYAIGQHFNLPTTNFWYHSKSSLDPSASPNDPTGLYQDWSAQAVLKRGGSFMVCHNALTNLAHTLAGNAGVHEEVALDEMSRNLLPGFLLVPAGVTAVQLAQEYGWKLYIT